MATKKISEFTTLGSLSDSDILPVVSGGANKKITGATLKTYAQNGLTVPADISDLTDTTNLLGGTPTSISSGNTAPGSAVVANETNVSVNFSDGGSGKFVFKANGQLQLASGGDIVDSTGASVLGGINYDADGELSLPTNGYTEAVIKELDATALVLFAQSTGGNIKLLAGTTSAVDAKQWLFNGTTGNLTLPAGGDIKDSNGNSVLGGGSTTNEITNTDGISTWSVSVGTDGVITMNTVRGGIEFGAMPEVGGPQHLHIMRPAGQNGATDLYFGDDYNYVKMPALYGAGTQGVEIGSSYNSGAVSVWKFGTDGDLVLPAGKTIRDTGGIDLLADSTAYKGFRAHYGTMYNNTDDNNGPINKLVIYKSTVTPASVIDEDTSSDDFQVTGLTGSDVVAMLVVVTDGTDWDIQTPTATLKTLVEKIIDEVILDDGVEGDVNTVAAMKSAFYANFSNFNTVIPNVKADLEFFITNNQFSISPAFETGKGATFNGISYNMSNDTLDLGTWGQGVGTHQSGDIFVIPGNTIQDADSNFLATPANDITITVTSAPSGSIGAFTVTGTLPRPTEIWPNSISDGGDDEYDGANAIHTNLATDISYNSGNVVTSSSAFGSGDYVVTYQAGIFGVFAIDTAIDIIGTSGDNGGYGNDSNSSGFDGDGIGVTGSLYNVVVIDYNDLVNKPTLTLDSVTDSGSTTTNGITVGSVTLTNGAVLKDTAGGAMAFGQDAGANQGEYAIAIGAYAGENQGAQAVAIGHSAGQMGQGADAVAVGAGAGQENQGTKAVAIGEYAGSWNQGANAVAIGESAGRSHQGANSIIINATGSALDQTTANTFTVAPIRNASGTDGVLQYNSSTKEVTYSNEITVNSNTWTFGTDGTLTLPEGGTISDGLNIITVTLDQFNDGGFSGTQVFTKVSDILYQVLPSGPTIELVTSIWYLRVGVSTYYNSADLITWENAAGSSPAPVGTLTTLAGIKLTLDGYDWRFGDDGDLTAPRNIILNNPVTTVTTSVTGTVADSNGNPFTFRILKADNPQLITPFADPNFVLKWTGTDAGSVAAGTQAPGGQGPSSLVSDDGTYWNFNSWFGLNGARPNSGTEFTVEYGVVVSDTMISTTVTNLVIEADDEQWKFGTDGVLTLPDNSVIASYKPVTVIAGPTSVQTISDNASATRLTFIESVDSVGAFTNSTFTVPYTGYYQFNATVYFTSDVTLTNGFLVIVNTTSGLNELDTLYYGAHTGRVINGSSMQYLTAGDTVALFFRQVSGNVVDIGSSSRLTIHRVSIG
jgi:hypothetical protein